MKFTEELARLMSEIETEPNAIKRFGLIQQQDALLANHRREIMELVKASQAYADDENYVTREAFIKALRNLDKEVK